MVRTFLYMVGPASSFSISFFQKRLLLTLEAQLDTTARRPPGFVSDMHFNSDETSASDE